MAGVSRDGDGIDMYPDLTETVLNSMAEAADAAHQKWDAKLGEIAALDSQLGRGPLGEAAEAQYTPMVDNTRGNMDQMKPRVNKKVDFGHRAVQLYVEQDRINEENMRRAR
jgi:hypothetical protein